MKTTFFCVWRTFMAETALAYLDESGDLGWKLDKPYQHDGSSRYFVIGIAVGRNQKYRRIGKVIENPRELQGWTSKNEKKWATIGPGAKETFCQLAAHEMVRKDGVEVYVAVCHNENAPEFFRTVNVREANPDWPEPKIQSEEAKYRGRAHLVYSMMVAETLAEFLPELDVFTYCADELNESSRTLDHIIAYRLLLQQSRNTSLHLATKKQEMQPGLDFADMCVGAVFEAYQFGDVRYLDILKPFIKIKEFSARRGIRPLGANAEATSDGEASGPDVRVGAAATPRPDKATADAESAVEAT